MQGRILVKSKHSQANIITLVLLIVISLAAVIIVWNIIKPLIEKSAGKVGTEALTVSLEIEDAKLWVTGGAEVKVKRGAGKGEITELKFIFEKVDGDSETVTTSDSNDIPGELETKTIEFTPSELPFNNSEISKVSLAPIFGNNAGIQVYELESEIQTDSSGERILDAPADNSLVSWWKFDGDAQDSVGENHGLPNGGVNLNYNDAIRGKVASFDGVDGYVNVGSPSSLNIIGNFTISAWIKKNSSFTPAHFHYHNIVAKNSIFETGYGLAIYERDIDSSIRLDVWSRNTTTLGNSACVATNLLQPNVWYYIVGTYNGTNLIVFLNGSELCSSSTNVNPADTTGDKLLIGEADSTQGSDVAWDGSIDDVMIFNKALSPEEIKAIYNNQKK